MRTKTITRLALLTALALALGYAEQWIPVVPLAPGIKLGLSNTVLLYALYLLDEKSAVLLMLLKVGLSGLLYAGFAAALFSLGGGILSLVGMVLLKRLGRDGFSIVGVSILGAVCHNIGQLLVAAFWMNTRALLYYLPILLVSAVITGALTGIAAKYVFRGLAAAGQTPEKEHKK
ncbi:MAG: Gx transporter family protein [Oscillospiraceae bacterium]